MIIYNPFHSIGLYSVLMLTLSVQRMFTPADSMLNMAIVFLPLWILQPGMETKKE